MKKKKLKDWMNSFEAHLVIDFLLQNRLDVPKAAKKLGINRSTLYMKIKKFQKLNLIDKNLSKYYS